jgi:hypothetical protein
MYFLSPKISEFIKMKLGYPEAMWREMQEEYIYIFLIFLETEVNLYLDDKNLDEELTNLKKVSNSIKSEYKFALIEEFIKLYSKYPEIKTRVDKKFHEYFMTLMAALLDTFGEKSKNEFEELLIAEAESYKLKRELLEESVEKSEI